MTVPIGPSGPRAVTPLDRPQGFRLGEAPAAGGPSFKDALARGVSDISRLQDESKDMVAAFLRGEPVELHDVMAASEEAGVALELLVEMRNKLTDAYRAVMNTQV